MGPFGSCEAVSSFAGHTFPRLLCCSLSASVTLQVPVTPMPSSICSPQQAQRPTVSLREPLTFTGMDRSCPSQVLNPLTVSIPPSLSALYPADSSGSVLEQMILVFPTMDHFLPAGGGLTGNPW